MTHILYANVTSVTGPKIADYLGVSGSTDAPHGREDNIIRWGNSYTSARGRNTLNSASAISNNVDKLGSLRQMENAGVPVPEFSQDASDMDYSGNSVVLGRGAEHAGGTDIEIFNSRRDARRSNCDFCVQYIRSQSEFRVHVVDGNIIKVSQKVYRGDSSEPNHPKIRNYDNDYHFLNPRERPSGLFQGVAAVEAMNLDFGAVDMIFDQSNRPYVLEVNTAPSCDPPTLEEYGDAFAEWAGIDSYPGLDNVEYEDEDDEDDDSGGLF